MSSSIFIISFNSFIIFIICITFDIIWILIMSFRSKSSLSPIRRILTIIYTRNNSCSIPNRKSFISMSKWIINMIVIIPFFIISVTFCKSSVFSFIILRSINSFKSITKELLSFSFILNFFLLSSCFFRVTFI